jgi:hypothetical protein
MDGIPPLLVGCDPKDIGGILVYFYKGIIPTTLLWISIVADDKQQCNGTDKFEVFHSHHCIIQLAMKSQRLH